MSRVSERVLDASPPVEDDREIRSLHVAPSLAMSTDVAEERDSQPAQRDELAHSHIVPTRGGVLPPMNVTPPTAITRDTVSLHVFGPWSRPPGPPRGRWRTVASGHGCIR